MKLEDVHSCLTALSTALAIPVLREDQKIQRPAYPYLSYKIMVQNQVGQKSAFVSYEQILDTNGNVDPTKFDKVTSKDESLTISVSILHDESLATIWDLANQGMDWIDSDTGMNACEAFGITPSLISGDVQNRTVPFDNIRYDYKVGFDVMLRSRKIKTEQTPKTDPTVTIEEVS